MDKINPKCPCPNYGCEVRGECAKCTEEHKGKGMYCKLPEWKKKVCNLMCKFLSKCPCPNYGCANHGKCEQCIENHGGNGMYCKRPKQK